MKYEVSGPVLIGVGVIVAIASILIDWKKFFVFMIIGVFMFLNGLRKQIWNKKETHHHPPKNPPHNPYQNVPIKYCRRCGFQIKKQDFYCPNCGTRN